MGAKESETLISMPNLGHCHLLLHLCLPKFSLNFLSLELKWSWCYKYNFWTELLQAQVLQACCSLLAAIIGDPPNYGHGLDF
jgi:hypothetical protein